MGRRILTPEERLRVAALFTDHQASEVARIMGCSETTVYMWASRLGAAHSPACRARLMAEAAARMASVAKAYHRRAMEAREKHRRREELRWLGGQPLRSGFRFAQLTRRARTAKRNICYTRGYRCCPGDVKVVLYDGSTRRAPRLEALYAERHGLRFVEAGAES